ncbi:MAG: AAA family ATPase [Actinomycetota bacterium]|nr:AAA family ATPase [Actinomycetota bacterium]
MTSEGVETLKLVARRSAWIVVLLVLLGAALMTLLRQSQGPEYRASARVVLSPIDLAAAVAGFQGYVDPELVDDTEQRLASARQLSARVAADGDGTLGSVDEVAAATEVSKNDATVAFSVTGSDENRVIRTANALASEYQDWRTEVFSNAIDEAIDQVETQLSREQTRDATILEELNRLRILRTLTSGNVLLVQHTRAAEKTRPSPVRDALTGGFIGLFVALLVVAAREAIDTRVRSEGEVEELLSVPVIGTVETLPRRTKFLAPGRRNQRYGDMYALLAASLARTRDGGRAVIAVTSATAEEGKTTTASNLAAALARRNADVLLVDLDSRKPSLARLFKIPQTAPGIDEVIDRKVSPERAMWTISLNGRSPNAFPYRSRAGAADDVAQADGDGAGGSLRVLPMRPAAKDGIVQRSPRLRPMVSALRKKADYVVLDTPPALSVPDMTEIAQLVDMVLIVVRHGRVSRRSLNALTRLHRSWPEVQLAAVLVGTPRHEDSYAYYGTG